MTINNAGTIEVGGTMEAVAGEATVEEDAELVVESGAKMTVAEDGVTYNGERWIPKRRLDALRSKQQIELVFEHVLRMSSPLPGLITELLIIGWNVLSVGDILANWYQEDD